MMDTDCEHDYVIDPDEGGDSYVIRVCKKCGDVDIDQHEPDWQAWDDEPGYDEWDDEPPTEYHGAWVETPSGNVGHVLLTGEADQETMEAINHMIDHVHKMLNDGEVK